jgi:hypothetical protein
MGRVRIFLSNRFAWLSALAGAMIADRRLFSLVIRLFRCISSMLLLSFALQAQAGMATLSHEDQTLTVDGACSQRLSAGMARRDESAAYADFCCQRRSVRWFQVR